MTYLKELEKFSEDSKQSAHLWEGNGETVDCRCGASLERFQVCSLLDGCVNINTGQFTDFGAEALFKNLIKDEGLVGDEGWNKQCAARFIRFISVEADRFQYDDEDDD